MIEKLASSKMNTILFTFFDKIHLGFYDTLTLRGVCPKPREQNNYLEVFPLLASL
jgi:hypothetical protein